MGTVHRVIYDDRLTVDDLHDAMTKEAPPPIDASQLPKQREVEAVESVQGNQRSEANGVELGEVSSLAQWFARECHGLTGQLRVVNEASFQATRQALADNTADNIKAKATAHLMQCRESRTTPPLHLGFTAG